MRCTNRLRICRICRIRRIRGKNLCIYGKQTKSLQSRVSFETSLDSKQPKLKPKLVWALSETKPLFRLFRFYTKPESFDVSNEPNQTEEQPKQFFDREQILLLLCKFRVVLVCFVCFETVLFVSIVSI